MGGVSPAQLKLAPEISSLVPRKRERETKGGRGEGGRVGGKEGGRDGGRFRFLPHNNRIHCRMAIAAIR